MHAKRLVLLFATFLASLFATAASVEERSPFRQGHWWDPSKSGHGFEILNASDQVFLVWYTYNDAGAPIWYTAQGSRESLGGVWMLQKHTWGGDRIARSENVGTMRLGVNHFEKMTASWQVGSTQGTWTIEPFVQSGTQNEVDLTGHWYDPAHSGWGMTLVDQGDVFGAVIYAYDSGGAPTWVAGFDRGKGTKVALYRTRGSCPSCDYRIAGSEPAGSIDISYRGDTSVTVRGSPAIALAPGVQVDGASLMQIGRPASTRRVDLELAPFATEKALRQFMSDGMDKRQFYSAADFSAAPPPASATAFSTTNLQESGVDEADSVKSDGRYVYALTPLYTQGGYATRKVRIAYVGDAGSTVQPRADLPLYTGTDAVVDASLYVHDGNLVTIATTRGPSGWSGWAASWSYTPPPASETHLEILSIANPDAPASRWRAKLSGMLVSSRRIGDRLYVITRFTPNPPGYAQYPSTDALRAANRAILDGAPIATFLPSISIDGGQPAAALPVSKVYAPQLGARFVVADMTVVSVFDIRAARLVESLAIAGKTDALYASTASLYLASSRYEVQDRIGILPPPQPALYVTDLHKVMLDTNGLSIVASGSVEGTIGSGEMASFRFSEQDGRLRVVTSTGTGMWGQGNANRLTILEPSTIAPGLLKTVSFLPNARRPEPLGKPNEFLHSTRFVGDRLYAVTFKKIDPLYVVDLSDRSDPKIAGALEIPGFSDYLHPLANGVLIGFGKDAKPSSTGGDGGDFAWYQGLHLTLFDVSNPSAPREIQRVQMGKRGSDSPLLYTHHAFSALPRADGSLGVAIPAQINDGGTQVNDWDMAPWDHTGLLRFEIRGATPADARIVPLATLVTDRPSGPSSYPPYDYDRASRSVLFPDASIFVSNGRFFRMDAAGAQYGPY